MICYSWLNISIYFWYTNILSFFLLFRFLSISSPTSLLSSLPAVETLTFKSLETSSILIVGLENRLSYIVKALSLNLPKVLIFLISLFFNSVIFLAISTASLEVWIIPVRKNFINSSYCPFWWMFESKS